MAIYSAHDAVDMLAQVSAINLAAELRNIDAAYADVTDEIKSYGDDVGFDQSEFAAALAERIAA